MLAGLQRKPGGAPDAHAEPASPSQVPKRGTAWPSLALVSPAPVPPGGDATERGAYFGDADPGTGLAGALVARSTAAGSLPPAVRARAEARTGVDLSRVALHHDAHAAAATALLRTPAATRGIDIYLGGQTVPSEVLVHEAVHAAQSLAGACASGPAAVESEARAVSAGEPRATPRLRRRPPAHAFSRYEGPEHQDIGSAGWQQRIPLPNYPRGLTYGELTSLAGDFFGSFDQLLRASAEEIDRILLLMADQRLAYTQASNAASARGATGEAATAAGAEAGYSGLGWALAFQNATGGRYLRLAEGEENVWHFSDQSRNLTRWREIHNRAIAEARAGRADTARAMDGYASHYLTDRFSAGHLRASVSAAPLERKRQHDYDNTHGLEVTNERGDRWRMYGDGRLHDPRNQRNFALAQEAVVASQNDIDLAIAGQVVPMYDSARTQQRESLALQIIPWNDETQNPPLPGRTVGEAAGQFGVDLLRGFPIVRPLVEGIGRAVSSASDDDRARAQINAGETTRLPVSQRIVMLRNMLSGPTLDADERAIIRMFGESTASEQVQMADAVNIEDLYGDIDGEELGLFIEAIRPMYRQWDQARKLQHVWKRLRGWTRWWEERVVLTILEECSDLELRSIVDAVGVDRLHDELDDYPARLTPLLRRAGH
jgi:hypothetical protein